MRLKKRSDREDNPIKHLANIITLSRIVFAVMMIVAIPFSTIFWVCYICGGISDMFDGYIARKLNQQSAFGAQLDSIADLLFALSLFIIVVSNIRFPRWLWLCIAIIALIRVVGYSIGFYKYHTFSSLHTYLNKGTGAFIFALPVLYVLFGLTTAGIIISFVAFASATEELIITIKSKKLNRDCKSLFFNYFL